MRIMLVYVLMVCSLPLFAGNDEDWTGYVQVRYSDNMQSAHSFQVRRIKLWSYRQTPFADRLYFKVQGIFRYPQGGALILQDAFAEYRAANWWLRIGQEVPDFSLQRAQPDFIIPLIERAKIINALIPAAETGARDVGLQLHLAPRGSAWQGSFGMFNGNGGNVKQNEDRWFLLTTRQTLQLRLGDQSVLHSGISFAYRETSGLRFRHISGPDTLFSGSDLRFGTELRLTLPFGALQAEYLQALLAGHKAGGYYVVAEVPVHKKHLLVVELEKYKDLNPLTADDPWIDLGYNYFYQQHKAKLMADLRVPLTEAKADFEFTLQTQLFFN